MPSLRAWVQGSGEPAYRQVVQRPVGHSAREGLHPNVPNLVEAKAQLSQLRQGPIPERV